MEVKRYSFQTVFDFNGHTGSITPLFDVVINDRLYRKNVPVFPTSYPLNPGLNLFNYIGQDIAGKWDPAKEQLYIVGFY